MFEAKKDQKPHKGKLRDWRKYPTPGNGLGYLIMGRFDGHPQFDGQTGHTSYVVKHGKNGEIETRNTRYTLVGAELPKPTPPEFPEGPDERQT